MQNETENIPAAQDYVPYNSIKDNHNDEGDQMVFNDDFQTDFSSNNEEMTKSPKTNQNYSQMKKPTKPGRRKKELFKVYECKQCGYRCKQNSKK